MEGQQLKQEQRVQKLEKVIEVKPKAREIMAAVNEDGTPFSEYNAKLLKEGKEAEARGEEIDWTILKIVYDG